MPQIGWCHIFYCMKFGAIIMIIGNDLKPQYYQKHHN